MVKLKNLKNKFYFMSEIPQQSEVEPILGEDIGVKSEAEKQAALTFLTDYKNHQREVDFSDEQEKELDEVLRSLNKPGESTELAKNLVGKVIEGRSDRLEKQPALKLANADHRIVDYISAAVAEAESGEKSKKIFLQDIRMSMFEKYLDNAAEKLESKEKNSVSKLRDQIRKLKGEAVEKKEAEKQKDVSAGKKANEERGAMMERTNQLIKENAKIAKEWFDKKRAEKTGVSVLENDPPKTDESLQDTSPDLSKTSPLPVENIKPAEPTVEAKPETPLTAKVIEPVKPEEAPEAEKNNEEAFKVKAEDWWKQGVESGKIKTKEQFVAEREMTVLTRMWRELYEKTYADLSQRQKERFDALRSNPKALHEAEAQNLLVAGLSVNDLENAKHKFLSPKIKSVLSGGKAVPEEEFEKLVKEKLDAKIEEMKPVAKKEIEDLYESKRAAFIAQSVNNDMEKQREEEKEKQQEQERLQRIEKSRIEEQAKIEQAEGISLKEKLLGLDKLREKWGQISKINEAEKNKKDFKTENGKVINLGTENGQIEADAIRGKLSDEIINIAQKISGINLRKEAQMVTGYKPGSTNNPEKQMEDRYKFRKWLTEEVRKIYKDKMEGIFKSRSETIIAKPQQGMESSVEGGISAAQEIITSVASEVKEEPQKEQEAGLEAFSEIVTTPANEIAIASTADTELKPKKSKIPAVRAKRRVKKPGIKKGRKLKPLMHRIEEAEE
jgi:hypothetical protein